MTIHKRKDKTLCFPMDKYKTTSGRLLPLIPPKIEPKSDQDCRSNYQLNGNREGRVTCKRHHRDVISKIQMVGNSRRPNFFGKKFPRRKNKGI